MTAREAQALLYCGWVHYAQTDPAQPLAKRTMLIGHANGEWLAWSVATAAEREMIENQLTTQPVVARIWSAERARDRFHLPQEVRHLYP